MFVGIVWEPFGKENMLFVSFINTYYFIVPCFDFITNL